MKMFQICIVLFVIGICTAVPQFETPTTEMTTSSVENEVSDITTITPDENEIFRHENPLESRKKNGGMGGMEQMFMMFNMCKSVLSTIMMLIQPIFQVKALSISFVGMLINIARFIMQLKASKSGGGGQGFQGFGATGIGGGSFVAGGTGSGGAWGGQDRIGDPLPHTYQPNYITRYTIKH